MSEDGLRRSAAIISSFIDIQSNRYDERRNTSYWAPFFKLWDDVYETDKSGGRYSFSECVRNANIETITKLLDSELNPKDEVVRQIENQVITQRLQENAKAPRT